MIQQIGGIQKFYRGDAKLELQKEIELIRGLQNKNLLDQMVMDIQHLELEVIRARYKLSFFLRPPYDEYLRMEIFSSMGSRYGGDPVYDQYLSYCGLKEYDDAIDTPFHLKRKRRLAKGHDDYPDYYP